MRMVSVVVLSLLTASPAFATFSIVAIDPATGDLGVAVASRVFGVGNHVPWAEAGVGAEDIADYLPRRSGRGTLHELGVSPPDRRLERTRIQ